MPDRIAVAKKDRRLGAVALDPSRINAEHIGPIEEICDATEAFRLALRAISRAGAVQPHQFSVGGGIEFGFDFQFETASRRCRNDQFIGRDRILDGLKRLAVERYAKKDEFVAIECQGHAGSPHRMRTHREAGGDSRFAEAELDVEVHPIDKKIRRSVIGESNHVRVFGSHRASGAVSDQPIIRREDALANCAI